MAKKPIFNQGQLDIFSVFEDWLVAEPPPADKPVATINEPQESSPNDSRHLLALRLAQRLSEDGGITSKVLTEEANRAFGGTQAGGDYLSKDAYDALEAAFNIHLLGTEDANWTALNADGAKLKVVDLTNRIQRLPTQTRRDEEMEEFQQFSTPPALSFVANWVANVKKDDVMAEPSAGTGDLAIWSKMVGATLILNELSPRRQTLLGALFPEATIFKENAEQLDNVLPIYFKPTVIVMNPPFSSSAGRVQGQRDTNNGARHIEQALKRLEPGGRLVAIVGNGMAADRPAFSAWWSDIAKKYNVRANIGISGKEYAKYGTTFDNQILVIDKNGATTQPILTGKVDSVADLPALLEGIRNDRQHIQSTPDKQASRPNTQPVSDTIQSGNGVGGISIGADGVRTESSGNGANSGTSSIDGEVSGPADDSDVPNDGIGTRSGVRDSVIRDVRGSGGGDTGGNSSLTTSNSTASVAVEAKNDLATEFTDSVFANYAPQRLTIQGSKPHPGKLVQSAAMSAVQPPAPSYAPLLPTRLIEEGLLSIAQIEAVVYAGQAHSETLPNGSRKGFFIGDGTGVGKGREISGILLDNMLQGRKKAVWVSFNEGLIEDAKRDFAGVGGDPSKLFFQGKTKAGNEITQEEGILFTTYSTLRGGEKKQANDLGQKGGKSRAQQIIDWLGKDFDGVIAFDEAHSMGNAIAIKGKRGAKKPSQQAIAGINLQRELPYARVTYVSATGATEISNLSYADRLGLWGEGTPFADTNAFINGVSKGGIASMELISRDMKAMGMYLARSLSYDGVSYERLEHPLSDLQEDIYNELAGAWQVVLNNVEQALELTQAGKSGPGKSAAMSQFWGAHQRFFNQIVTAMQTPAVIDHIRDQLSAGHAAVIQLVNTNEAAQERIIADATANDALLEELDFTPRQMLMDYVRNGFPVAAYEETKDDNGNITYVPVRDSEGNQVFDREAIALRDSLLDTLHQIRVPENPLDSIINAFGSVRVAEVTGRGRRFVQTRDDEGNLKVVEEKRGKNSSRADAEAFQADKKDILIFSGAGGTGYSFHADNTAENQRKRIHYILQPGWRADAAVQGFGRTHRTNQAQEPHYVLPTTNLKAQKRFVSSIARRLDQLGALTRGQREASSQGMFTASDNLESQYASTALNNFFRDLYRGTTSLSFHEVTKQMGLNLLDENASLNESNLPAIPQFLNRLLSLKTDMQNQVFGEFEKRLVEAVDYAKQRGLYDVGLQTMTALSIQKTRDDVAYEDKKTGAQTRYVELAVTNEIHYYNWNEVKKFVKGSPKEGDLSGWFVSEFGKSKGDVFYLGDIGERLDSDGKSVRRGIVHTIKKHDYRYIDNADVISRGYDYRTVNVNGVGSYQKVTLTRPIDEAEAEKLWNQQVANAPKTETKTERMLVGVILPIWDRVEGAETIQRLQTDDGEQLLGRMLGPKSAKQTLKNLGLDSGLSGMSTGDLFESIRKGNKAILSNGWEISISRVNLEDRIEIKGRSYFTDAEKRLLKEQGAFVERINWTDRVFMPTGENGVGVFERITASKPVVDLIEKNRGNEVNDADDDQEYGIPNIASTSSSTTNEAVIPDSNVGNSTKTNKSDEPNNRQEVISMDKAKKPFHETVAEKLIEQLEQGTAPWQRPWNSDEVGGFLPYNPVTGNRYKGINTLHLLSQDRNDNRWMTYKQAGELGGQVRKGEKGTGVQYWKFTDEQTKRDESGNPVLDGEGNSVKVVVKLERPRVFFATVFNAEQIDGLPPLEKKEVTWDPIERAENILAASGAALNHNGGGRAFYRPSTDSIHLPDKGQFPTAENYYATALHELGHWTGHEDRLNRDIAHPFGSEAYAKEELRAEIASMILGEELGIGHDPGQHAAYVGSWIKALRDDPMEIFRAASDAEKIQNFVLGFEQVQVQERSQQESQILTVAELTAVEYQALVDADEIYQRELVRVYGEDKAGDARYQKTHEDTDVQQAADAFHAASDVWHTAVTEARNTLAGGEAIFRINSAKVDERTDDKVLSTGLAADISIVLLRSEEWTFDHFQDYEGESLDAALRKEGLHSLEDVTGNVPSQFFDTAIQRLSPVFGIEPNDLSVSNAYLERKGLAQAFQAMAERLVQDQAQQVSSPEIIIPKEGIELDRRYVLDMFPELNGPHGKANGFGISKITLMPDGQVVIDSDSKMPLVAETTSRSETGVTHQDIAGYFERGFLKTVVLPESSVKQPETAKIEGGVMRDPVVNSTEQLLEESVRNVEYAQDVIPGWRGTFAQEQGKGNVQLAIKLIEKGELDKAIEALWSNVELEHRYGGEDSDVFRDSIKTVEEGWRKWQVDNGVGPAITPAMKKDFDALPRDLSQLSSATFEEYKKAAEAARLEEDAVKNNPDSTDEDISAAREKRKSADLLATVNDSDFQNKVAEFEQKQVAANLAEQGGNDKTFITVPFREKEDAKALGAKWDRQQTSWYIPAGVDQSAFSKWLQPAGEVKVTPAISSEAAESTTSDKLYLAVPYAERFAAKQAGAKWDAGAKSWYVSHNANMETLQRWLPDNHKPQQAPAMTPREEFSSLLKDMGFVLSGNHPVMDGQRHRLETVGDKAGEKAGFYVAHLDGHPAGFAQNNRTGEAQKWKSKGYSLSDGEKAALQAQSASKLQARENELKAKQDAVAASIRQLLAVAPLASADHKYLQSKEARPGDLRVVPSDSSMLPPDSAVMIGKTWKESKELRDSHPDKLVFTAGDLLLAAQDVGGVIRSVQSIQENGMKRFAAGGAKQDMFHVVGGNGVEALARAPAIVIGEGYATADTLSQSLGYPTVAAFDSGNLPHVAKLLRDHFPGKPFIIAGDNDLHQELTEGRNPGKEKAEAAAKAVGGVALFPIFAPGEQAYPADLAPVTPALAKAEGLSGAQKEAISQMKSFTDFNDLATKSELGREGVERQVTNVVNKIVSDHRERIETRQQQDNVQGLKLQQQQKLATRNAVAII
ncbi:MAG: hypothetical protein CTY34_06195 [Methylobacter sp.]|nr:MAG: hypothetical protein CTY34_06195 [Methylobacter sp.]